MTKEKDPEVFAQFLDETIFQCQNFDDYINRNGGITRMKQLRRQGLLIRAKDDTHDRL